MTITQQTAKEGSPYDVVQGDDSFIIVRPKNRKENKENKVLKIYVFDDDELDNLKSIPRENYSNNSFFNKYFPFFSSTSK
jgi:hypothetical protein